MTKAQYTPGGILVGKVLRCGCCGLDFKVRPSYRNQDQDLGYGICSSCQDERNFDYITEIERHFDTIVSFYESLYRETKPWLITSYKEMLFPEREKAVLRFIRNKIWLKNLKPLQISLNMANHLSLYKLI